MKTIYLVRNKLLKEATSFKKISEAVEYCLFLQDQGHISCYVQTVRS